MLQKRILQMGGIALVLASLYSCFPTISSSITASRSEEIPKEEILILGIQNTLDAGGTRIGDSEFKSTELNTDCKYEDAIEKLKEIASKNGGNVIKITEQKAVSAMLEDCVSLKAEIYYVDNLAALKEAAEKENAAIAEASKSEEVAPQEAETEATEEIPATQEVPETLPEGTEYAILYIYRENDFVGIAINYDVYLDDEVVYRAKVGKGTAVKVYTEGKHTIWAETESKVELPVEVEFGKEYYIRCSVKIGLIVGRPGFKLMDPAIGKTQYDKVAGDMISLVY